MVFVGDVQPPIDKGTQIYENERSVIAVSTRIDSMVVEANQDSIVRRKLHIGAPFDAIIYSIEVKDLIGN